MKNILTALALLLFVKTAVAQKDSLAFDENNKYIYYQTVAQPAANKDTLYNRGAYFLTSAYPKTVLKLAKADKPGGALTATGTFMVSKKTLLNTHGDGAITYTLKIEVKDEKYRYWFTDFVYKPYERNRYGSFEAVPGLEIPLEQTSTKIEARDMKGYLDQVLANSRKIGTTLKSYMIKTSSLVKKPEEKKINKISTKDW